MGFLVSQHGQLGAKPPPPFLSVSPLESMQRGGAIPTLQKGYFSDTCAMPDENTAKACDTPSAILSRKGIARYGGVSRTGPLSFWFFFFIFGLWRSPQPNAPQAQNCSAEVVVDVGLPRSGTTSFTAWAALLGYKTFHYLPGLPWGRPSLDARVTAEEINS